MNSGASTVPTKMFAAVDNATAPPTPNDFWNTYEKPLTMSGSIRQYVSREVSALTTITSGSERNANTRLLPTSVSSNGRGAPPR